MLAEGEEHAMVALHNYTQKYWSGETNSKDEFTGDIFIIFSVSADV